MKAMVYTEYGAPDVLHLADVAKPSPKEGEVLIKVHAVGLNYADSAILKGKPFLIRFDSGLQKPKNTILGADIAGVIEAVGSNVTQFKVGDAVFGDTSGCGFGGLAEYVAVPETVLALKPDNISFEEAAAVPMASITALQGIRDTGHIQAGQKVLIYGASGGVGTYAVQIAKAFDTELTAVASTSKLDMLRSLGADHVIDYTREDFTQNGETYDLIIAVNGYRSLSDYKRALSPNGTYVVIGGTLPQIFEGMLLGGLRSMGSDKTLTSMGVAKPKQEDLLFMAQLLASGKVKPLIDKCYSLNEAADAFRYLGEGHASGKIVITLWETNS